MEMARLANRAEWLVRLHDEGLRRRWRQEFAAALDHRFSIAVGKESEVPDLHKSAGQDMQEEPPNKLDRLQCHLFNLIVVLRVSPAEADPAILQA
jgi:hypothetical protein